MSSDTNDNPTEPTATPITGEVIDAIEPVEDGDIPARNGQNTPNETDADGRENAIVKNGRDQQTGRFVVGNRASVGHGGRDSKQRQLRLALQDVLVDQMPAIAAKLAELAVGGNVYAARVCFEFGLGKPAEEVVVDVKTGFGSWMASKMYGLTPEQLDDAEAVTRMLVQHRKFWDMVG